MFSEDDPTARDGFGKLITQHGWDVEATDPAKLILFPEMDETVDVPEITTACWGILDVHPDSMMCANSRMVVRRKGEVQLIMMISSPCYSPALHA